MRTSSPIVFLVFNRPECTAVSFAEIRRQRPESLYLVADGPRPGHVTDPERCDQVRHIIDDVDWPCKVRRLYADVNLGIKKRVSSGLDWVFAESDRAIVLEDDCVAHTDFFSFCEVLLERYANDERVGAVTGDNFQDGRPRGSGSYYFSKYPHVWGWATWQRAWRLYDLDLSFWPAWRRSPSWRAMMPDDVERRYWERILDRTHRGEIDTWDYQWTASLWRRGLLTATPNANLVENIGFGLQGTHTTTTADWLPKAEALGQINPPHDVVADAIADQYTFDHHFSGAAIRARRHPAGFLRWVGHRAKRRLKRS